MKLSSDIALFGEWQLAYSLLKFFIFLNGTDLHDLIKHECFGVMQSD